ncbi:hypothetical protein [Streptomyces pseudogriseolus]|uniref:hypothetical protein n=1 Tax=Streptomyces pseudogriseolus TaxID=36817 RepID=UPI003FA1F8FF
MRQSHRPTPGHGVAADRRLPGRPEICPDGPRAQGEETVGEIRQTESGWAAARVSAEHLRALTTLGERSVPVADHAGRPAVIAPDAAGAGCLAGTMRLLATRADLLDAGLPEPGRARRLTGPVAAVCTSEAASLNAAKLRAL